MKDRFDRDAIYREAQTMVMTKVGMFGSLPLGCSFRLAETFGLSLVSSDEVRNRLIDRRIQEGQSLNRAKLINGSVIQNNMLHLAGVEIVAGNDVYFDKFMNSPKTRKSLTEMIAVFGGITVALDIETPESVIRTRISDWIERGTLELPIDRWSIDPTNAYAQMRNSVVRPEIDENISHIFKIAGDTSVDSVIEQVEDCMEQSGLLEQFVAKKR